ncbi:MAG: hypothetical protein KBD56_08625 [Candidatus Eisenbacteria bacterium]|nr:hypothetical protein [Candidatus Eisenbacteria bacterium]
MRGPAVIRASARVWRGALAVSFLALVASSLPAQTRPFVNVEAGAAFNGYNDVRIPPDTGSEFSLTDDLSVDPAAFFRLRFGVRLGERHEVSALIAPLRFDANGSFDRPIQFNGVEFPAGTPVDGRYRFDSYRLTYLYRIWRPNETTDLHLGLSAKIRDAAIGLEAAGLETENTNTGFVPLIAFRLEWRAAGNWALLLEGDALASPQGQGRAEDVFAGVVHAIRPHLRARAGYRILEGGADVEKVYNFALVHYLSMALEYRF